jgi:hypothetical protein
MILPKSLSGMKASSIGSIGIVLVIVILAIIAIILVAVMKDNSESFNNNLVSRGSCFREHDNYVDYYSTRYPYFQDKGYYQPMDEGATINFDKPESSGLYVQQY